MGTTDRISSRQPLYSPKVLAAYSLIVNLFLGCILYGVNLSRRGKKWQGRLFVLLSGIGLFLSLLIAIFDGDSQTSLVFLFNGLVAISLYRIEKPHFERAICPPWRIARWWLPLIWIILSIAILWLGQFL